MEKVIRVHNPNELGVIEYSKLKDFQGNLKSISKDDLEKLRQSILKHGIFVPKFVWRGKKPGLKTTQNYILDGHQTIKALESLDSDGYEIPPIPVVEVKAESYSDAKNKLLLITSRYGKVNEKNSFFRDIEPELVKLMFEEIEMPELQDIEKEFEENFPEINEGFSDPESVPDDNPESENEPDLARVSKQGDIWLLGDHRLYCGSSHVDSLGSDFKLFAEYDCIFLDPPWQIGTDDLIEHIMPWLDELDGNLLIMYSPKGLKEFYAKTVNLLDYRYDVVWHRRTPHLMPTLETPMKFHNSCDIYSHGSGFFIRHNSSVTQILDFIDRLPSVLSLGKDMKEGRGNKPVNFMQVMLHSFAKNRVLDLFAGNGSTMIACERIGMSSDNFEIDLKQCDKILQRYYTYTNIEPRTIDGERYEERKLNEQAKEN